MSGFYRRFIPSYAEMVEPLTRLLNKENIFVWEKEQEKAFLVIKMALTQPPILSFPDQQQKQILTLTGQAKGYLPYYPRYQEKVAKKP